MKPAGPSPTAPPLQNLNDEVGDRDSGVTSENEAPPSYDEVMKQEHALADVSRGSTVIHEEGYLMRKHEWEDQEKKAMDRNWTKVYVVLDGALVSCYKSEKHAKEDHGTLFHHESSMNLGGADCQVPKDYLQKPYVFRLKLSTGGQYLFKAKNQTELEYWINRIISASKIC